MKLFSVVLVAVRPIVFVFLLAAVMAVGSERIFWFWSPAFLPHLEVAAFYMIAVAAGVLLIRRYRVNSLWSLVLVGPIVAYVVEGVLTPVVYTGGPFVPVFPAWFTFWHGLMSFLFMVVLIRHWLLQRAIARLSVAAVVLGAFWAVWASTLRLPENLDDEELIEDLGTLEVLAPADFGRYALVFTAVLLVAHFAVSFVWPSSTAMPRRHRGLTKGEWLVGGLVTIGVVGWTVVVPWALPMFALYSWIQIKALRWHRASVTLANDPPRDLLEQLQGRVSGRALAPLMLMAPTAAVGYAVIWEMQPPESTLRFAMYSIIALQAGAGFVLTVAAFVRARRSVSGDEVSLVTAIGSPVLGVVE